MLPNFLFIGPDKSGSSWLHSMLRSHSMAWVPGFKDVYFFDRYYDRGLNWYADLFTECPATARAVGEISHDYLFSRPAAERIRTDLPDVRLLTFLRDPVDRTFSQYLYFLRSGRTQLPFEAALDRFPELTNNSLYYKHLSVYFELFEKQQIGVFWFHQLEQNAEDFTRSICDFLQIEFEQNLEFSARVRPASRARSAFLARAAKKGATIARDMGLTKLVGAVKHGVLSNILYEPYKESERPVIDGEVAARLRDRFAPDVLQLQSLVGKDLSGWMTGIGGNRS